jgi:DNA-binding CsgD family transcriptional regulator
MLEAAVGPALLEQLERSGLLTVRTNGRRRTVTLSHPLFGETLRARMPMLSRHRLLLELAEHIERRGARRREDRIRAATARLEATGTADPELLVQAARLARFGQDFARVEQLARAARASGSTTELGLLLGEALHERGRFDEADDVLSAAEAAAADDDPLLVHVVEIRARNLMWGLHRNDEALAVNAGARRRAGDRRAAEELALNEALLLTYAGRPLDSPALIATGRPETAVGEAVARYQAAVGLPELIAIPDPGVLVLHQIYAMSEAGWLGEATALATAAYDATPPDAPPDALMWLSFQVGRCALLAGHPVEARRWLGESLARCDATGNVGPSRLALSGLVIAHAYLGDVDAACATVALLESRLPFAFTRPEQELGRAWASVAAGDLTAARAVLLGAADLAAATGYACCEAWALHDVARLGEPAVVRDRLRALADRCEGELVAAYAAHAAAAADGDARRLVSAAEQFERIGMGLLAAEAATEAARAFRDAGDGRAANAQEVRAVALAERCEGARTPGLMVPLTVTPLTPRERDIASMAARGESSKAIAARLVVSVRTVDNHLQNVYTKLGISGRRQLADALAALGVSSQPDAPGTRSASPR